MCLVPGKSKAGQVYSPLFPASLPIQNRKVYKLNNTNNNTMENTQQTNEQEQADLNLQWLLVGQERQKKLMQEIAEEW
jgi:hypothetical protein